ncbi:MAG: glycoside hydrolase domain-containing protein [Anaerocolumna sp.]
MQTQIWVNNTYTGVSGYTPVTEDGITGTSTFKALIRALQIELGIAADGEFGNGTLNACPATISEVPDVNTAIPSNLTYIIQGAFWCKGYNPGGFDGIFGPATSNAVKTFEGDAGITQDGIIRPYILQAIMNTDGYALAPSGDVNIRAVQTGLNSRYGATFGLSPSNGIWERNSHKNLIKALQTECGVAVDGSFGSGTLSACPTLSVNTSGYTNTKRVLQWALCINGYYPGGFTGTFGTGTYNAVVSFQTFYSLTADGVVGKNSWGALMTSCGDTSRKATACDCATILTAEKAATLKSNGYSVVGRYLTGTANGISKALTASEIQIVFNAGLRFFPIYQSGGAGNTYFNSAQGTRDARAAIVAAENLGIPSGSIIYFAIDYDALDVQVTSNVLPYFQSIKAYFSNYATTAYRIGVYGSRNTCTRVCDSGYVISSFVGDMSSGYSGNLGYKLPANWAFDQFYTVSLGSGNGKIEIDKDSYSSRDTGVDHIVESVTRPSQDISVYQPAEAISADPVDTGTGSHTIHMEVLKVKGAIELPFELNYNSSQLSLGTMGKGWSHNYEIKLVPVYNDIYVYWTSSIYSVFTETSEGIYATSDKGKQNDILTVNTDGTYSLNRNNDRIYTFTSLGKLTSVRERTGKSITVTTDSSGNMVLTEPVSGRTLTIGYHVAGFVSSVTDNMGRTTAFVYDANACLTTFTDANGKTTAYTYDNTSISNRLVVTITNRNGDTRTNIFDGTTKQLLSATDENGNTKSYTYDSNGNNASMTDELGNMETTTYNNRNQPLVFTSRSGSVTTRTYDTAGNLLTVINPDGGIITNTYDGENRLQSTIDLRGNTTSYTYNGNGKTSTVTDAKGNITTYTYDREDRLIQVTDADGKATGNIYDKAGRTLGTTDALGNLTSYTYDAAGNVLTVTKPGGGVTVNTYYANGKLKTQEDAAGNITIFGYAADC